MDKLKVIQNMRTIPILMISLMVSSLLIGCVGNTKDSPIISYYTIDYPSPDFVQLTPLPNIIRFEDFQISPLFDSNRIYYREAPLQQDAYHYHKWRVEPVDLIPYLLKRDFQKSGLFQATFASDNHATATHVITGTIDEIYEFNDVDTSKAILAITIILLNENAINPVDQILFQRNYSIDVEFSPKSPQNFTFAMSQAMASLSKTIILDTYQLLAKNR
jgi:ABC-type uncharacterized transport system auxiliary subunit